MISRPHFRRAAGAVLSAVLACAAAFLFSGCSLLRPVLESPEPDSATNRGSYTRINDTARFLAGLSGSADGKLRGLRGSSAWRSHASRMDQLWKYYRNRVSHVSPVREAIGGAGTVFYPFGGPDYIWADAFFPGAQNTILVGLEGIEALPDLNALSVEQIETGLNGIANSLKTVTGASYFITKDMKVDLASTEFRGVVPLLLVMCARNGHSIQSVETIGLSPSGTVVSRASGGACPGWHIVAGGKNIYYFRKDLSDSGLSDPRLLEFIRSKGAPVTFVKSASYLMHYDNFSIIRNFILSDSRAVLQDPSGVPFRYFAGGDWRVDLYGNYVGPLDIFSEFSQPDLKAAYRSGEYPVTSLKYGVGYLRSASNASLIWARR